MMRTAGWLMVLGGLLTGGCTSAPPSTPTAHGRSVFLSNRSEDGGRLTLSDGSRWAIQPVGQGATLHWPSGTPIVVQRVAHPIFPFRIIHAGNGSTALGRLLQVPPLPVPPS